jgi:hypothetical protein
MGVPDRQGNEVLFSRVRPQAEQVMDEMMTALKSAMIKHAPMHSPHEGCSVLREEFEELWDHVKADTGRSPEARKEAIQVAAMAIRYVLDLIDGDSK